MRSSDWVTHVQDYVAITTIICLFISSSLLYCFIFYCKSLSLSVVLTPPGSPSPSRLWEEEVLLSPERFLFFSSHRCSIYTSPCYEKRCRRKKKNGRGEDNIFPSVCLPWAAPPHYRLPCLEAIQQAAHREERKHEERREKEEGWIKELKKEEEVNWSEIVFFYVGRRNGGERRSGLARSADEREETKNECVHGERVAALRESFKKVRYQSSLFFCARFRSSTTHASLFFLYLFQ